MNRRVLIVVSAYAPTMMPDNQRARMLAWELPKWGWDVGILTPNIQYQSPQFIDSDSQELFCAATTVYEAKPWRPRLFDLFHVYGIAWRAWRPLYQLGSDLIAAGKFDLVYISTSHFPLMCLGPKWHDQYGVPYLLDFQDPWYRPERRMATSKRFIKAFITERLAKPLERWAVTNAAGVVAVSPTYLETLANRYAGTHAPWLKHNRCEAIPFAASEIDLAQALKGEGDSQPISAAISKSTYDIVYVGAAGVTRSAGFEVLCAGLAELRRNSPELVKDVKIRLYGTNSASSGMVAPTLQHEVARYGLQDLIEELPRYVTYRESLRLAGRSAGLLILGSDDAGYTPSKLFSYLLVGKPLLATLRMDSPAYQCLKSHRDTAQVIPFGPSQNTSVADVAAILREFFTQVRQGVRFDRRAIVENHLSSAMAREHAQLFERCLENE